MFFLTALKYITCKNFASSSDLDSYEKKDTNLYDANYSIPFCNTKPFFQFGKCPEKQKVYTLFDNFYVQLKTINVKTNRKNDITSVNCDNQDILYLISIMKHLKSGIVDESMARWFLRLFKQYILEKVDRNDEYTGDDSCDIKCFALCPGKITEQDFVEQLTKDRCSRFLLFSFLRFLHREIRTSLKKCNFGGECRSGGNANGGCCGSGNTGSAPRNYCGEIGNSGRFSHKKNHGYYTNYKLYLNVIEVFILRLKRCIRDRSRDPLSGLGLNSTLIIALNAGFLNATTGITLLSSLLFPTGIIIPDNTTNSSNSCNPMGTLPTTGGGLLDGLLGVTFGNETLLEALNRLFGNAGGIVPEVPDVDKPNVKKPEVPDVKKPDVEKPDVKKPDVKKPEVPDVKKPDVDKPDVKKPEVPDVKKPDVEKPDVKKPEVPDVKKPDVEKPDVKKPEVPDVKKPDVEKPEVPDVKKPDVDKPDVKRPEVPDVKKPDVEKPEVPDIKKPDVEKPEVPDVKKPEVPDVKKPDVEKPDVEKPDVAKPEVPDIKKPDVKKPDVEKPEVPDIKKPDVEKPNIEKPEVPDIKKPDVEKPNIEKPDLKKPDVKKPNIEKPEVPDIEKPDVEKPDVEKPDVEKPDVEKPDVKKPDVEKPDVKKPDIQKPEVPFNFKKITDTKPALDGVLDSKLKKGEGGDDKAQLRYKVFDLQPNPTGTGDKTLNSAESLNTHKTEMHGIPLVTEILEPDTSREQKNPLAPFKVDSTSNDPYNHPSEQKKQKNKALELESELLAQSFSAEVLQPTQKETSEESKIRQALLEINNQNSNSGGDTRKNLENFLEQEKKK